MVLAVYGAKDISKIKTVISDNETSRNSRVNFQLYSSHRQRNHRDISRDKLGIVLGIQVVIFLEEDSLQVMTPSLAKILKLINNLDNNISY